MRSAGASIRLYTNDAFHSQYNPNYLFMGAVWDLLALPSLFREATVKQALILGVGGGTVIHQLNRLHSPTAVTGVEIDPVHVRIAQEYFGLNTSNTKLITTDARRWLQQRKQKHAFDYLVDDIFLHGERDPARPFAPDRKWFRLLTRQLSTDGVLVQNHIDLRSAKQWLDRLSNDISRRFTSGLLFTTDKYENAVIALYNDESSVSDMRRLARLRLEELPKKDTRQLRASWQTLTFR